MASKEDKSASKLGKGQSKHSSSTTDGEGDKLVGVGDQDYSIHGQIVRVIEAARLFFQNQFEKALELCKQDNEQHLYLTLSYGTMSWLRAWMTFEKPEIEFAIEALKKSVDLSSARKRHYSWMDYLRRTNYDEFTEEEIHAELAYADSVFMLALITFVQDQSFLSLIKGACRFRYGFQSYKICQTIIQKRTKWQSEVTRREFASGVHAGTGIYNLALSMSPPRVLRILEFMGFSGERSIGIDELTAAAELDGTGRSPFAIILLLINFSHIETMIGWGEKDITRIEDLLDKQASHCPKSVFLPLFTGKLYQLKGNCDDAIKSFNEAIKMQDEWKQLHNACNWEIMWNYAVQGNWTKASEYADKMRKESLWSPCTFTYQYAVYLYMLREETNDHSLSAKINDAMREVPTLKRRFAGKSTPREKFACRMAEKFIENGGKMVVPAYVRNILYLEYIFKHQCSTTN
uniref:Tetratricopeptide repeat protein 39B n=1 Tax=Tetranychus urticae TaxID=32264 RepID=T1KFU4_TETUR